MKRADTTRRAQEKRKGFTKKIGNTTYDISFHYSRQSRESMNDKIIHLIENDMQDMKKGITIIYQKMPPGNSRKHFVLSFII